MSSWVAGVESTEMKCKEGSKVNIRTLRPGKYAAQAGVLWSSGHISKRLVTESPAAKDAQ